MSRIGRKPVSIPQGVKVQIDGATVRAEGPKGKLMQPVPAGLSAKLEGNQLVISRSGDDRKIRALHGLARALVANMGTGVKDGFERKLDIVGIGYRAQIQGRAITLALGSARASRPAATSPPPSSWASSWRARRKRRGSTEWCSIVAGICTTDE